ncbi:MAG: carbohydrate binding family 9 domain-containing protein [Acidobacteria bacterium]|nr:carbohydrate binding family 9 domain-containing protein [Acidobacteriota bacterium]
MPSYVHFIFAVALTVLTSTGVFAQNASSPSPSPLHATITRDERGRVTMRAVRLETPLRLDGRLDEEVYRLIPPADGFIQQVPREGEPATETTEFWVFFDDEAVYFVARLWDSHPELIVADELRRDHQNIARLNDLFSVGLDTMHDQRTGYMFLVNPLGAMRDGSIGEGSLNTSWNGVWDSRAARFDRGWTVEIAVPFKSLRYRGSGPQVWGINARRVVRWKNEASFLTRVPASYGGGALAYPAVGATLVGLETPETSLSFELKPYAVSALVTDRTASRPATHDLQPNAGIDLKYGLTRGLTADFTVNTDFAQVEEDLQQVNLTRFSLFFPEKRDFFLEGQSIFDFGGQVSRTAGGGLVPIPFFSRRIGLSAGQAVPVVAGARVTGKAGAYDIGMVAIRTDDKPSANALGTTFSAFRLRRNVLRRSSVGAIATGRWPAAAGSEHNALAGADVDLRFYDNLVAGGYWARTSTPAANGDNSSYRARVNYNGDRYGLGVDHLVVEERFNPEVGFVRRKDFAQTIATARFSPRLRNSRYIRQLRWQAESEYIQSAAHDALQDRQLSGVFGVEFNSGDDIQVSVDRAFERLPLAFSVAPRVIIPAGDYRTTTLTASYAMAPQRLMSGTLTAVYGSFYAGTRTGAAYGGRAGISPHVALEPTLSLNWIESPFGDFTSHLASARLVVAPTARLAFSTLTQFNASARSLSSSLRMRWEYSPGSDVFVVYSEGRDTSADGGPSLQNRSLAVKVTRLLRL